MSFITRKVLANSTVPWKWPVQTGIFPFSFFTAAALRQYHWSKELSEVSILRHTGQHTVNLIMLYGMAEAIDFQSAVKQTKQPVQCTAILIRTDHPYPAVKRDQKDAEQMAATLARLTGAGGVFFFQAASDIATWQNDFIVELSHNKGIPEAIASVPDTRGFACISPGLEKQTRISTLIGQLSKDLLDGTVNATKPVTLGLINPWEQKRVEPGALGAFLRDHKNRLDYSGESRTGSSLLEITRSLKTTPPKRVTKPSRPAAKKAAAKKKGTGRPAGIRNGRNPQTGYILPGYIGKGTGGSGAKGTGFPSYKTGKYLIKKSTLSALKKLDLKKPASNYMKPLNKAEIGKMKEAIQKLVRTKAVPRYLQARFSKKGSTKKITDYLLPKTDYLLHVWIGELVKNAIRTTTPFDTSSLFSDKKVKEVMIDLEIRCNTSKKILTGSFRLPREGDSGIAKFPVSTGQKHPVFEASIYAYHKSRLLQKLVLKTDIRHPDDQPVLGKPVLKPEAVIRKKLEELGDREAFAASIVLPDEKKQEQPLAGLAGNKPAGIPYNRAMQQLMDEIQDIIEEVTTDERTKKTRFDSEDNSTLIKKLAFRGARLYNTYLKKIKGDGPIQIISNTGEYAPLEFAYSFAEPDLNATVCPRAKEALEEGACKNCFHNKEDRHAHICPFGFWGLSRVIERHSYKVTDDADRSDYVIRSEPSAKRSPLPILRKTLFAETNRMENGNKGIIKQVDAAITANCGDTAKADTWKKWNKLAAGKQPESFILIVHNENDQVAGECLEIGESDLLPVARFNGEYISAESSARTPFVILIGCETTNVKSYAFDASHNLIGSGAAIVVSNFTKVRGLHAGTIVMRLVSLLKQQTGTTTLGSIILKLRQQLVAEGVMASLSLLCHGDADWKIKI